MRAHRLFLLAAVVLVAVVALGLGVLFLLNPLSQPIDARSLGHGADAIWIDVNWTSEPEPAEKVGEMVRDLERRHFRYVYVYVNSLGEGGIPKKSTYAYASHFLANARAHAPELKYIAWVGIVNVRDGDGIVDIQQTEARQNIVDFCHTLTAEIGFDGVQLDVEPLPSGDRAYLDLLERTRAAIGHDKILAIASNKWRPAIDALEIVNTSYWDSDYYLEVARRVDQMAVMTYDTYLSWPFLYKLFLRYQVANITSAVAASDALVFFGVPTYDEPRPNHDPASENMENALQGIIDGIRDPHTVSARVGGVAVYAHWTTEEHEWAQYDALWLGKQQP